MIEVVCVSMFTVELLVRSSASVPAKRFNAFLQDPMNWIDLLGETHQTSRTKEMVHPVETAYMTLSSLWWRWLPGPVTFCGGPLP